jgi:hypothetical protein
MADSTETQTKTAPASGAASSSDAANSNAGSDTSQTSNTGTVDTGSDAGKSTASDEASGAADGGERQRPGRAERRISELTKREKELQTELEEKNSLLERLSKTPVDDSKINFPDYSGVDQITPDQLKKDILATANQLVDARMNLLGSALLDRVDAKEISSKSAEAISSTITKYSVLNPNSDDYDEDLDKELSAAYGEARSKNPSYSFTTFIKPFERLLEQSSTTEKSTSTTESSSRGRSAARPSAATRRSANEFPADGTAAQMEEWFAKNRG